MKIDKVKKKLRKKSDMSMRKAFLAVDALNLTNTVEIHRIKVSIMKPVLLLLKQDLAKAEKKV